MGAIKSPMRRCIASGNVVPTDRLIRFVVGPNDELVPDLEGRLPGRGLWVSAAAPALAQAVSKDLFSKSARRRVRLADDLIDRVERLLVKRCQSQLGLARRGGAVVLGFEKVRSMIRAGDAAVLITASDASADGRIKLARLDAALERVHILNRDELSLAVGRENVVHAALARGRLAAQFVSDGRRLAGFRLALAGTTASLPTAMNVVSTTKTLSENARHE